MARIDIERSSKELMESDRDHASDPEADLSTRSSSDHEVIRRWAEERGGRPAKLLQEGEPPAEAASLHIEFSAPVASGRTHSISWEEFFGEFDRLKLELTYTDEPTPGGPSRFWRLVPRSRPAS